MSHAEQVISTEAGCVAAKDASPASPVVVGHRRVRRHGIAKASAAGLIALATPLLLSCGGPAGGPVTPSTASTSGTATSASPTTTATTATSATTSASALQDAYAVGDTLRIGGRTIQLEHGTLVHDFAVLDGGGAMVQSTMGKASTPIEYEIVDPTGHTVRHLDAPTTNLPGHVVRWAASPDGRHVLLTNGQRATVYDAAGTVVAVRSDSGTAGAIVGNHAYLQPAPTDQAVRSTDWNIATGKTRVIPNRVWAVSRDGRLAAVRWHPPGADGYQGCWAILDLEAPFAKKFEHCRSYFEPRAFSATGTYVIGDNYLDGGFVNNLAVARADNGTFVIGGAERAKWYLGWSMRMSEDERTVLVARDTNAPSSDTHLDVVLIRCSLTLTCTTVQPKRHFELIGRPPYMVAR